VKRDGSNGNEKQLREGGGERELGHCMCPRAVRCVMNLGTREKGKQRKKNYGGASAGKGGNTATPGADEVRWVKGPEPP